MKVRRWITAIAIATVCVLLFLQGGIADAASSATRRAPTHHGPGAPRHHEAAVGTAAGVPWQAVDTRFGATASGSTF
jgi:hypothetical protein